MVDCPGTYGRVIRDRDGNVTGVVEFGDLTEDQKAIKEINDGMYAFDRKWFLGNIGKVKKSSKGEYYVTDLIKISRPDGNNL